MELTDSPHRGTIVGTVGVNDLSVADVLQDGSKLESRQQIRSDVCS